MDKIIYTLVTKGGGVDGLDFTDTGGKTVLATFSKEEAENSSKKPWCDIVPVIVDVDKAKKDALAKLSPVDKLVLNLK